MLDWMQKRRRRVAITVWVSMVALVFAGLVEWGVGGFVFGFSDDVAVVGGKRISRAEFHRALLGMIDAVNASNSNLDAVDLEKAKDLGLDRVVLNQLVQKELILSFARDIGLRVSDGEVRFYLEGVGELQSNGVFDESAYRSLVRRTGMKLVDFERGLKEKLLLNKVMKMVLFSPTNTESESFIFTRGLKHDLSLRFVPGHSIPKFHISLGEDEIRSYWNVNKSKYVSDARFDIAYVNIALSSIEVSRPALESYYSDNIPSYASYGDFDSARYFVEMDYRRREAKVLAGVAYSYMKNNIHAILEGKRYAPLLSDLSPDQLGSLRAAIEGGTEVDSLDVSYAEFSEKSDHFLPDTISRFRDGNGLLKPIDNGDSIIVPYVISKIDSVELGFEEARSMAESDLMESKHRSELKFYLDGILRKRDGMVRLGSLSYADLMTDSRRDSVSGVFKFASKYMGDLSENEIIKAFQRIFVLKEFSGYVDVRNGILLYAVESCSFPDYAQSLGYNEFMSGRIRDRKDDLMIKTFVAYLDKKYKTELLGGVN